LVSAAAHDIKNALNNVIIPLTVVVGRAGRSDAAADVERFATTAYDEMTSVIRLTEAVLGLTRPTRATVEVSTVLRHVALLVGMSQRGGRRELVLDVQGGTAGATGTPGTAVRLALTSALMTFARPGTALRVQISAATPPVVTIAPATLTELPGDLRRTLARHGVRCATAGHGISMTFAPVLESLDPTP
jgi:hypothetical protein